MRAPQTNICRILTIAGATIFHSIKDAANGSALLRCSNSLLSFHLPGKKKEHKDRALQPGKKNGETILIDEKHTERRQL